jgi:uncharacterized Zn finger protein (UPF0148 family)
MSDGNIVDLNQKRLDKALTEERVASHEVVRLIACTACSGMAFELSHDGRIFCHICKSRIGPLMWIDTTTAPDTAG